MKTNHCSHEKMIIQAIALSRKAALELSTGGAFGAVIVKEGKVIAEGMNQVVAHCDPTWHAEMEAIRRACATLQSFKLHDCILYTSAEPCPMCMAACYWADIKQVYYAATVEDAMQYGDFNDKPIYEQLALPKEQRAIPMTQLCREQAIAVWREYQSHPNRVPY